jgi:GTP cyclohydrolase I
MNEVAPIQAEQWLRDILVNMGIKNDEVLDETPRRWVTMFQEMLGQWDPVWKFTTFESDCNEMVICSNIPFVALCEHHLLPFLGVAHIGYIPQGRLAGLSKLARSVQSHARGLWVQEDLTKKIADFLEEQLDPKGVAVVMSAEHTCMTLRGVKAPGAKTTTSSMTGVFRDMAKGARQEFLELIRG